jgi:hypothetical protein
MPLDNFLRGDEDIQIPFDSRLAGEGISLLDVHGRKADR